MELASAYKKLLFSSAFTVCLYLLLYHYTVNNDYSVSGQLSDRTNYRIKHPIIILWKYPGLDYQKLANHFNEAGKL